MGNEKASQHAQPFSPIHSQYQEPLSSHNPLTQPLSPIDSQYHDKSQQSYHQKNNNQIIDTANQKSLQVEVMPFRFIIATFKKCDMHKFTEAILKCLLNVDFFSITTCLTEVSLIIDYNQLCYFDSIPELTVVPCVWRGLQVLIFSLIIYFIHSLGDPYRI